MQIAVVDIETTGNNMEVDDIIQIGIVIVEDGKIISSWDSYVYTEQQIPTFITQLTNINKETLKNAPTLNEISEDIFHMLKDKVFVAHNIHFDLNFIQTSLERYNIHFEPKYMLDTVDLLKIVYPSEDSYQLSILAQSLNVSLENAHSAIDDAYATALLFIKSINYLKKLPKKTLILLYHLSKKLRHDIDHLLFSLIEHHTNQVVYDELEGIPYRSDSVKFEKIQLNMTLKEFYTEVIKKNNLIYRQQQLYLVETIYDQLMNEEVHLIEAEVGSGKSLAYLIAATFYMNESSENILITTATKALQQQLIKNDLIMIEHAINQKVPNILLKSKKNYISVEFVNYILNDKRENHDILLLKMQLLVFLMAQQDGDIERLNLNGGRKIYFDLMAHLYKHKQDTYLYSHIKEATVPVLGITNHSHLLHSNHEGFPKYFKHLIIDEAHQLQEVALDQTYTTYAYQFIKYQFAQLTKEHSMFEDALLQMTKISVIDIKMRIFETKTRLVVLEKQMDEWFQRLAETDDDENFHTISNGFLKELQTYVSELQQIEQFIQQITSTQELKRQLLFVLNIFEHILFTSRQRDVYYEVQQHNRATLMIHVKDKSLRDIFNNQFKAQFQSITLLSGTLLLNETVEHLTPLFGKSLRTLSFNQTFNHRCTFFVPTDVPSVNDLSYEAWLDQVALYIMAYLSTGHDKILILFNNYQMIKDIEEILEVIDDHAIIAQSKGMNAHKLLQQFNQMDKAILLGTQSFYEGLDYQSNSFKCVMLVTLPFIHPHDKRLMLMKDEVTNTFNNYQLPYAATKIKQAAGRLIRNEQDTGIIICLDSRITDSHYSQYFNSVIEEYDLIRGDINYLVKWIEKNHPNEEN